MLAVSLAQGILVMTRCRLARFTATPKPKVTFLDIYSISRKEKPRDQGPEPLGTSAPRLPFSVDAWALSTHDQIITPRPTL